MPRLVLLICALVLACPVLFAGCGDPGSSSREGQGGAGTPASEGPTQPVTPGNAKPQNQSPVGQDK
jgi:hypothetical protein